MGLPRQRGRLHGEKIVVMFNDTLAELPPTFTNMTSVVSTFHHLDDSELMCLVYSVLMC